MTESNTRESDFHADGIGNRTFFTFWFFVFVFFASIIGVLVYLIALDPNQDSEAYSLMMFTLRLMCALSAAIVAAMLPGMLDINMLRGVPIKASGALAVFVLIWTTNPPKLGADFIDDYAELLSKCEEGRNRDRAYKPENRIYCDRLVAKYGETRWGAALIESRLAFHDDDHQKAEMSIDKSFRLLTEGATFETYQVDDDISEIDEKIDDVLALFLKKNLMQLQLKKYSNLEETAKRGSKIIEDVYAAKNNSGTYHEFQQGFVISNIYSILGNEEELPIRAKDLEEHILKLEDDFLLKDYLIAVASAAKDPKCKEQILESIETNVRKLNDIAVQMRNEFEAEQSKLLLKCYFTVDTCSDKLKGGYPPRNGVVTKVVREDEKLVEKIVAL